MLALIRAFLAHLPGEIEKEVNLVLLAEIFIEDEISGRGFRGAVQDTITRAAEMFPDPAYRAIAVKSLTLLSNILSHHSVATPVA